MPSAGPIKASPEGLVVDYSVFVPLESNVSVVV